jgi:hypothetical protein
MTQPTDMDSESTLDVLEKDAEFIGMRSRYLQEKLYALLDQVIAKLASELAAGTLTGYNAANASVGIANALLKSQHVRTELLKLSGFG